MPDATADRFPPAPWRDDGSFLQAFFAVLAAVVARLSAECAAREARLRTTAPDRVLGRVRPVSVEEIERRLAEAREQERGIKTGFTEALQRHRRTPEAIRLGIDTLTEADALDDRERFVLLACSLPATSVDLHTATVADLPGGVYGSLTVETLISLVVDDPNSIAERIAARSLFATDGRLVRHGLIAIDYPGRHISPEDVLSARVQLTWRAFAALSGHVEFADGPHAEDGPAPSAA